MAQALYRAKRKSYVQDRLVYKGDEFPYDGIPSIHWQPLNAEAQKQMEKAKQPKGKSFLDKAKAAQGNKLEVGKPLSGKATPAADASTDAANDKKASDYNDEELTNLIGAQFAEFKHDDAHFTKQGKPNLNVLSEMLGFTVDRETVDRLFPNYVRQEAAK